jgi:hypothetical protein
MTPTNTKELLPENCANVRYRFAAQASGLFWQTSRAVCITILTLPTRKYIRRQTGVIRSRRPFSTKTTVNLRRG